MDDVVMMFVLVVVVALVDRTIWAVVCRKVIINRGYGFEAGKWTLWGFIFGLLAFLVAVSKPENRQYQTQTYQYSSMLEKLKGERNNDKKEDTEAILKNNGWECPKCKTVNRVYVSTCRCGFSKKDAEKIQKNSETEDIMTDVAGAEQNRSMNNIFKYEELKKLKELLDLDIISQEEFDKKKKELFG